MQRLENMFKEVNERFNNDINLIIQSFISFYGIENSEYIMNRIKDSRIIWYDDNSVRSDNIYNHIISSIPKEELDIILKQRNELAFLQSTYIDEIDILISILHHHGKNYYFL